MWILQAGPGADAPRSLLTFAPSTDRFASVAKADRTAQRVRTLAERVRGLDAVFSCGAAAQLPEPIELHFHGQRRARIAAGSYGDESSLARRLKRECSPAPFGVGSETRRDPRVRDGDQLLAHDGALSVVGLDLVETGILDEVRRALCPGAAKLPDAELHALNVYTRDGHFVRHKDTPRDRACFGTLVVCLPLRFRGGRLVLRQGESTRIYGWESDDYWRREEPCEVSWAAFYGDVDHEIEPVTDGTRATLTWLLRSTAEHAVTPPPPAATELDLETALREALLDASFLAQGGTLGVPCTHLYAETEGLVRPSDVMSEETVSRLKGRDRKVAFAAVRTGLRVRYRPYLFETCAYDKWRLSRAPTEREARIFQRRRLGYTKLTETMPIELDLSDWKAKDDVTWIVPAPFADFEPRRSAEDSALATELLGDLEYSATDYFGNEGGDAAFYVSAALLLDMPLARDRGATGPKRTARSVLS